MIQVLTLHIANINRVLKSIKSEIVADFARVENSGIIITTNKVAAPLDFQMIKQYIKNVSVMIDTSRMHHGDRFRV